MFKASCILGIVSMLATRLLLICKVADNPAGDTVFWAGSIILITVAIGSLLMVDTKDD